MTDFGFVQRRLHPDVSFVQPASDWAREFLPCMTRAGILQTRMECRGCDLDGDGDVDMDDFGLQQRRTRDDHVTVYVIVVPSDLQWAMDPNRKLRDLFEARMHGEP